MTHYYILCNPRAHGIGFSYVHARRDLPKKMSALCWALSFVKEKSSATLFPEKEAVELMARYPDWLCEYAGTKW